MSDDVDIRVRLQGGKVVEAEARGVANAIDDIGDKATKTSTRLAGLRAAAGGISGSLGKVGEASKTAGMYLGGAAVAATGFGAFMGLKFNAQMESATTAFTQFLGSTKKARSFLNDLYVLAAKTPFEFTDLTAASQKLLSFGFTAKGTARMLRTVGDAAAGLGKSGAEIDQLVLALGQIRAKGKLQGDELMQLSEFGIAQTDIRKQLGLTADDFTKQMQKGAIGADRALSAIQRAMNARFKGAAAAQSKTFTGQLSTLKDMAAQTLGNLTLPLFNVLRDKVLPGLNAALPGIQKTLKGAFGKLPVVFAKGEQAVGAFLKAIEPAKPLWDNVLAPLLKGLVVGVGVSIVGAFKVAWPVFKVFMQGLGLVGKLLAPLKGAFQALGFVVGLVFAGPILKGIGMLGKFGGVFRIVGAAARAVALPIRGVGAAFGFVFRNVFRVYAFVAGKLFGLLKDALPKALAIGAFAFRAFANKAWSAVSGGIGRILGFLGGLGSKFASAGERIWKWLAGGLKNALGSGLGFAGDLGKALANSVIGFLNDAIPNKIPIPHAPDIPLPDNPIPMLARGGTVTSAGAVLVGERGPEVLRLSKGARVDPLPKVGPLAGLATGGGDIVLHNVIELDGKTVAQNTARHARDANNRR